MSEKNPLFTIAVLMLAEALIFQVNFDLAWSLVLAIFGSAIVELIKT